MVLINAYSSIICISEKTRKILYTNFCHTKQLFYMMRDNHLTWIMLIFTSFNGKNYSLETCQRCCNLFRRLQYMHHASNNITLFLCTPLICLCLDCWTRWYETIWGMNKTIKIPNLPILCEVNLFEMISMISILR